MPTERSVRTLLVIPPGGYYAARWRRGTLMPPLGVTALATFLRSHGVHADILDAHVQGLSWGGLRRALRSARPRVVGVHMATETRFRSFRTIRLAKEELPDCVTVAGGPHPSLAAEDTLRHLKPLDVVVRGEGEQTLLDLCRHIEQGEGLQGISGTTVRAGGRIVRAPDRPVIADLDALPIPDRSLLDWQRYRFTLDVPGEGPRPAANLSGSRGCPFGCVFCAASAMWGKAVRFASPERIVEEAERLVDQLGVTAFWFCDDTFTLEEVRVRAVCRLLRRHCPDVKWFCQARVGTVSRALLREMRDAGCCRIGVGVESGSPQVLAASGKGIRLEDAVALLSWCPELGIVAHPFFILGHPGETREDARKTMEMARSLDAHHEVSLSLMHIYPGTELERVAKAKGILPRRFSWALERPRGITILPHVQGHVPLFIDRLRLHDMMALIAGWRGTRRYVRLRELPRLLAIGPSPGELIRSSPRRVGHVGAAPYLARAALARFGLGSGVLPPLPLRLWIEPTNRCNLACSVCPQASAPSMATGNMTLDLFRAVVDEASGAVHDITLHHRGEPLLHPELPDMIEYAKRRRLRIRLHTNGTLLRVGRVAGLLDGGVDFLSVSFRDRDDAIENTRRLLAMKQARGLRTPFVQVELLDSTPQAAQVKESLEREFRSLPLDRIVLKKTHNWAGSGPGNGAVRLRTPCLFPWSALVVLWNGDVTPCPQDFHGELVLGNVNRESLAAIWKGAALERLRQALRQRRFSALDPCRRCDMLARPGLFGVPLAGMRTVLTDFVSRRLPV